MSPTKKPQQAVRTAASARSTTTRRKAYRWHPAVNYNHLSDRERGLKACLDLYSIFSLYGRDGLTCDEIYDYAHRMKITGYAGITKSYIVRNNMYRWNDAALMHMNGNRLCSTTETHCKKPACWGDTDTEPPTHCTRHKLDNMTKMYEERLICQSDVKRYRFSDAFGRQVYGSHWRLQEGQSRPSPPLQFISFSDDEDAFNKILDTLTDPNAIIE